MIVVDTLATILAPLSALLLPGLAWLPRWASMSGGESRPDHPLLLWAKICITSVTTTILLTLLAAFVGWPQLYVVITLHVVTAFAWWRQRRNVRGMRNEYKLFAPVVIFIALYLAFSIPYLVVHDGQPSGDIQKSLVWAYDILRDRELPNYQRAITDFNRDPVDFYTPGLHTVVAYTLAINDSPTTAGFFAIAIAIAAGGIGMALAKQLFPHLPAWLLVSTTGLLILTNVRWLRYLREPGYHVQNSVGELLLFGLIFLLAALVKKWDWPSALIAAAAMIALAFTHQFSAFIAAGALLPWFIVLAAKYIRQHHSWPQLLVLLGALLAVVGLAFSADLWQKVPHLFSTTPHLLGFVPSFGEYFSLMGGVWFALGISGLVLLVIQLVRQRSFRAIEIAFAAQVIIILALSQGPRLFIDIPPIRALFYTVIPLSITGAYILSYSFRQWRGALVHRAAAVCLAIIIAAASYSSLASAYRLSHTIRVNSTFLPAQQHLIDSLQKDPAGGGVLIDDYNRRSASWLILAGRPMFARIADDLRLPMAEAKQSPLRYRLYLNQLDYEKIFALGSHPLVAELLAKHDISFITGIAGSSADAFAHNPALVPAAQGGDTQLFKRAGSAQNRDRPSPAEAGCGLRRQDPPLLNQDNWLLRASTLVNDIGDLEDTLPHLSASLLSSRISEPHAADGCTFRTSDAQLIPLSFNAGNYVAALWSQEHTGRPDIDLELLVVFADSPTAPLRLRTPTGATFPVPTNGSLLRLPAEEVPFDERGAITLTLLNPSGSLVKFDLIALGLAQVP